MTSHKRIAQLLAAPLTVIPFFLKRDLLEELLNWVMTDLIEDEELDFLRDRCLKVDFVDLKFDFLLTANPYGNFT